ncbi:unnamed protein product, partial [Phaeothamnion confervicola]
MSHQRFFSGFHQRIESTDWESLLESPDILTESDIPDLDFMDYETSNVIALEESLLEDASALAKTDDANAPPSPAPMDLASPSPRRNARCEALDRLTITQIEGLYAMTMEDAAKSLGVSVTRFKRACRRLGVARWPHRHLARIDATIRRLE